MIPENPFTPTFGEVPAYMAGREIMLNNLRRAFSSSKRHPNLTTIITGARGTGKTALLAQAADEAEQRGWIAVSTVALPGLLDDVYITAKRRASHLITRDPNVRIESIEFGGIGGIGLSHAEHETNWRNDMSGLLEELARSNAGLLIIVDEVQPKLDEMIQLAAIYQLFVMEGRKVALLMAGLPNNMLALEKDKSVSFLRRAQKMQLGPIPDFEVKEAFERTVRDSGRTLAPTALSRAVDATGGFPFLMQLIGFRVWDQHPGSTEITEEDAQAGITLARAEFEDRILKTTYESISNGDKAFLDALVSLGGQATIRQIADQMEKTGPYATQYKNRLMGQGIIKDVGGIVCFQLPHMEAFVRDRQD